MTENRGNNWTRRIASLAVHSVASYDELDSTRFATAPEARVEQMVFGEFDPGYSEAIDTALTRAEIARPRSFSEKLSSALIVAAKLDKKLISAGVKMAIEDPSSKGAIRMFASFTNTAEFLPRIIGDWIKAGEVAPRFVEGVQAIARGIEAGDVLLKTKLFIDAAQHDFRRYGIDIRSRREFFRAMIAHNYPDVANINPRRIDLNVLQNIQDYGLVQYLPAHMYFWLDGRPSVYGELYRKNAIEEYRARPKRDQVSPIPYQDRLRAYNDEVRAYQTDRLVVVDVINDFAAHQKKGGLGVGYDKAWILRNLDRISRTMERVLSAGSMEQILRFSNKPKVESFERHNLSNSAGFTEVSVAIKVALDFAKRNGAEDSLWLLQPALLSFSEMITGLYDIQTA